MYASTIWYDSFEPRTFYRCAKSIYNKFLIAKNWSYTDTDSVTHAHNVRMTKANSENILPARKIDLDELPVDVFFPVCSALTAP